MMRFAVRSSIHPTSAPTGTCDDIEGNNKLTPFAGIDEVVKKWGQAVNNVFSNPHC